MRILIISHCADHTGAPLALLRLVGLLSRSNPGFIFDFLLLYDGPLRSDFQKYGKVYVLRKNKIWTKILRKLHSQVPLPLRLRFRLSRYDCIFANTVCSVPDAIRIKNKCRIPIVAYIHEGEFFMQVVYGMREELLQKCDSFITVSSSARENLCHNYHISAEKISLFPPSSVLAEKILSEHSCVPKESRNSENTFIIGFSLRAHWIKSVEIIPLIIRKLNDRYPEMNSRFMWVGSESEVHKTQIGFALKKMGLEDKLIWVGDVEDPLPYYSKFDVNLLLSKEESFSLVTMELASMGKPTIWFKGCIGIEDWFPEDNWLAVPYMDLDSMCDKIHALYADRETLAYYGQVSRKAIEDNIHKTTDVSGLSVILSDISKKFS